MKKKQKAAVNKILWFCFILYIILLIYFLFFSEHYGRTRGSGEYRYNLTLFREIRRFIVYREKLGLESFIVNILGNIVAFIPFGCMLPILSPKNRKFFYVFLLSLELTLTIELLQLLLKVGIFDVDDILLNTLGGIIGYGCFALVKKWMKK